MLFAISFHGSPLIYWGASAVLSILISAAVTLPVKARQSHKQATPADTIVFHDTFDPPGDDSPDHTSGVGTRDGGDLRTPLQQPTQALMPRNNFGLTFAERPTVFVQLPENTSAHNLILTVTDEKDLYYAEENFSVANQTGLLSLSLSAQSPALEVGRNYRWHVVVVCGEQADPDNVVLAGWVQRVATTSLVTQVLQQKSPLAQAKWLGGNGYWYDMVAVLSEEIKAHPNDERLQTIWQSVVLRSHQA
ncbi:MAG: DUF928 domain-containing protein [Cyanobacteria bacterium P01_D01_bin.56]